MQTKNFTIVEVPSAGTTVQRHALPIDQTIEGARRILAIQACKVSDATRGPVSGAAVVNDAVFNKSFLVLTAKNGGEVINRIPLSDLNRAANNGQLMEFGIEPINMTKSYIQVASTDDQSASEVFLLGFHFEK